MSTIFAPATSMGDSTAKQPVAWKNGTDSSITFCGAFGSGAGMASPRRISDRAPEKADAITLEVMLRCVARAPFGFPVVPEV